MDIDYNTLPDLAGADGHILNLSDYSWSLIDYRLFYGIVPMFGPPQSLMYDGVRCLPISPLNIIKKHFNSVWPD